MRSDIPQEIVDITSRAMAKADNDRYGSASELARAIEGVMDKLYPESPLMNTSGRYGGLM